jgi:hypothetical protein
MYLLIIISSHCSHLIYFRKWLTHAVGEIRMYLSKGRAKMIAEFCYIKLY